MKWSIWIVSTWEPPCRNHGTFLISLSRQYLVFVQLVFCFCCTCRCTKWIHEPIEGAVSAIQRESSLLEGSKMCNVLSVLEECAKRSDANLEKILELFFPCSFIYFWLQNIWPMLGQSYFYGNTEI
jgi:hypothetical protein